MKRLIQRPLALSIVLVLLLAIALAWNFRRTSPQRAARAIWFEHEQVLSFAAMGKPVNLSDFRAAALFFNKLTGINVPVDHSAFIDAMPNQETAAALEPLRRWYAENKDRLYWDEERQEIMLAPENE
jgi:glucan phosphoethanolaminetransferase (alkaline phosphatase superfamily)